MTTINLNKNGAAISKTTKEGIIIPYPFNRSGKTKAKNKIAKQSRKRNRK